MDKKIYFAWGLEPPGLKYMDIDDRIDAGKDLARSLGLKSDAVGRMFIELSHPEADEIIGRLEAFCQKEGWLIKGYCRGEYENFDSDWYEIKVPFMNWINDKEIFAYKYKGKHIFRGFYDYIVSDRFRKVCIENNIPGMKFSWVKDRGKYESMQYFYMSGLKSLEHAAYTHHLNYSDKCEYMEPGRRQYYMKDYKPHGPGSYIQKELAKLGEKFPHFADICYKFAIHLPFYYPEREMPEEGIIHAICEQGSGSHKMLLVHKKTAGILLREKLITQKMLSPVMLYTQVPDGYKEVPLETYPVKSQEFIDKQYAAYEEFIKKPRPKHKPTEKQALSMLRKAKRDNKEDYGKQMKKAVAEGLAQTPYAPLAPYYLVADGGWINSEYTFLSYAEAQKETAEFVSDMEKEELMEDKFEGIVFAKGADGDRVILAPDGVPSRVGHDSLEAIDTWDDLAMFFSDVIEMEDD